nr:NADH dehydrogenase subunit 3 [Spilopyra sumptuosa]
MIMTFNMSFFIILLLLLLLLILNLVSKKSHIDREKSSPFECGFDPKSPSRLPFSLQFFLIAVIFLIFDVELTMLLPLIYSMIYSNILNYSYITIIFINILFFGLIHEWKQGALNWKF